MEEGCNGLINTDLLTGSIQGTGAPFSYAVSDV